MIKTVNFLLVAVMIVAVSAQDSQGSSYGGIKDGAATMSQQAVDAKISAVLTTFAGGEEEEAKKAKQGFETAFPSSITRGDFELVEKSPSFTGNKKFAQWLIYEFDRFGTPEKTVSSMAYVLDGGGGTSALIIMKIVWNHVIPKSAVDEIKATKGYKDNAAVREFIAASGNNDAASIKKLFDDLKTASGGKTDPTAVLKMVHDAFGQMFKSHFVPPETFKRMTDSQAYKDSENVRYVLGSDPKSYYDAIVGRLVKMLGSDTEAHLIGRLQKALERANNHQPIYADGKAALDNSPGVQAVVSAVDALQLGGKAAASGNVIQSSLLGAFAGFMVWMMI